jgi:hypothetical protein
LLSLPQSHLWLTYIPNHVTGPLHPRRANSLIDSQCAVEVFFGILRLGLVEQTSPDAFQWLSFFGERAQRGSDVQGTFVALARFMSIACCEGDFASHYRWTCGVYGGRTAVL